MEKYIIFFNVAFTFPSFFKRNMGMKECMFSFKCTVRKVTVQVWWELATDSVGDEEAREWWFLLQNKWEHVHLKGVVLLRSS